MTAHYTGSGSEIARLIPDCFPAFTRSSESSWSAPFAHVGCICGSEIQLGDTRTPRHPARAEGRSGGKREVEGEGEQSDERCGPGPHVDVNEIARQVINVGVSPFMMLMKSSAARLSQRFYSWLVISPVRFRAQREPFSKYFLPRLVTMASVPETT